MKDNCMAYTNGKQEMIDIILNVNLFDKNIDTKCDTTYNIDRRYSQCQNGINY